MYNNSVVFYQLRKIKEKNLALSGFVWLSFEPLNLLSDPWVLSCVGAYPGLELLVSFLVEKFVPVSIVSV